ncbi:unnamed product [Ostreococcus tauri]|uniref:Unnamed product n=1 Tax=Ostreococcus tauri TaxID=70448 RepID=A0A090MBE8_OSTTA|nr:unnamed product [Ostreococcus tauri]CEG00909.1 unnamed product [Ostreococcus tauri]|eukprot:XP_003074752.2 unnamed product [Ostreococcus tauri]
MARAELGVNNAKRAVEDAERKRQDKKRKEEDLLCQAIQDAPTILARIESLNDLRACTRAQLITLHRSVLRLHPKGQPKKADLVAELTQAISKEIESRHQHAEQRDELPGVPMPVGVGDLRKSPKTCRNLHLQFCTCILQIKFPPPLRCQRPST